MHGWTGSGYPISEKAVSGRAVGSSFAESAPRPDNPHRPTSLYASVGRAVMKVWTLIPKEKMAVSGWSGILEDRCVPSDESLFNYVPRSRSRSGRRKRRAVGPTSWPAPAAARHFALDALGVI